MKHLHCCSWMPITPARLWNDKRVREVPVSYTHLDVYKRQVRMEQGFQVLLQAFGGLALFLYGTDSLDVYKRQVQQGSG